jgi:hypothetical protein
MGHFHQTIKGIGKNRKEAEQAAISEFLHENGHRHSVRDTSKFKLLRKVPPMKQVETIREGGIDWRTGRVVKHTYIESVEDPSAPQKDWLEEWEFELHTHA